MSGIAVARNFIFNPSFVHLKEKNSNGIVHTEDTTEQLNQLQSSQTLYGRFFTWIKLLLTPLMKVFSLVCFGWWVLHNWNVNAYNKCEVDTCRNAFRKAHLLRNDIIQCGKCKEKIPLSFLLGDSYRCSCGIHVKDIKVIHSDDWVPLLENKKLEVWRKRINNSSNNYLYKVKGYIENISGRDFLRALMNVEYRMEWDKTTVELNRIKEEPKREIIYWRLRWPPPYMDRDYVFQRRFGKLNRYGIFLVQNNTVTHSTFPEKEGVVRVKFYRSIFAVNPFDDLKQPGFKFSLLYQENPGEPYSMDMLMWFLKSGLQEFLTAVKRAAVALPKSKANIKGECLKDDTSVASESQISKQSSLVHPECAVAAS